MSRCDEHLDNFLKGILNMKKQANSVFPHELTNMLFYLRKISGDANKHPRVQPEKTKKTQKGDQI